MTRKAPKAEPTMTFDEMLEGASLPSTTVSVTIGEHDVEVRLRSLSAAGWQALLQEHRPSRAEQVAGQEFAASFPAAAIAACAVEPPMTVDQVRRIIDEQPMAVYLRLWNAVLALNIGGAR